MTVYDNLDAELSALDCRFGMLDISRIADVKNELNDRLMEGQIEQTFFDANLRRLESGPSVSMQGAKSVIIIAAPLAVTRLQFDYKGKNVIADIPPYYAFMDKMASIRKALGRSLGAADYEIADARIPYKLAAVRCGLAQYGQNNLVYIDGMGSFLRLVAFFTDLPAPTDNWNESQTMDDCTDCGLCRNNCPTFCLIPMGEEQRFLAYAGRCLTLYNEEPGEFPEWIEPSWHNALIGCILCQSICPVDQPFLRHIPVSETFSEHETSAMLSTASIDDLPVSLHERLNKLDMDKYYDLIPRNLKVLLEQRCTDADN